MENTVTFDQELIEKVFEIASRRWEEIGEVKEEDVDD